MLEFRFVELEGGWLIFALPAAEMGVHPGALAQDHAGHSVNGCVLYQMCDDLAATVRSPAVRGCLAAGKSASTSRLTAQPSRANAAPRVGIGRGISANPTSVWITNKYFSFVPHGMDRTVCYVNARYNLRLSHLTRSQ